MKTKSFKFNLQRAECADHHGLAGPGWLIWSERCEKEVACFAHACIKFSSVNMELRPNDRKQHYFLKRSYQFGL